MKQIGDYAFTQLWKVTLDTGKELYVTVGTISEIESYVQDYFVAYRDAPKASPFISKLEYVASVPVLCPLFTYTAPKQNCVRVA